jgi:hypothetical protein
MSIGNAANGVYYRDGHHHKDSHHDNRGCNSERDQQTKSECKCRYGNCYVAIVPPCS